MTASTANSGRVCSQARMASAKPCETRNWAASAAQAISTAEPSTEGKVHSAETAPEVAAAVCCANAMIEVTGLVNGLTKMSFSICLPSALISVSGTVKPDGATTCEG